MAELTVKEGRKWLEGTVAVLKKLANVYDGMLDRLSETAEVNHLQTLERIGSLAVDDRIVLMTQFGKFPGGLPRRQPRQVSRKINNLARRLLYNAFCLHPVTFPGNLEEALERLEGPGWMYNNIYSHPLREIVDYRDDLVLGDRSEIRGLISHGFRVIYDYHQELLKGDLGDVSQFSNAIKKLYDQVCFGDVLRSTHCCKGEVIRQTLDIWGITVPKERVAINEKMAAV